jgi:hypothetical protein
MACHAEGQGWVYWCTSAAKNKLSGELPLSIDMIQLKLTPVSCRDESGNPAGWETIYRSERKRKVLMVSLLDPSDEQMASDRSRYIGRNLKAICGIWLLGQST